jgi:hypothetical protein
MMRFRATVVKIVGSTRHSEPSEVRGTSNFVTTPDPVAVEIVEDEEGFLLQRLNDREECLADTWHETLDAAKAQAKFEFELSNDQWRRVERTKL